MFQLVREWAPGYGGVERVAHEVASAFKGGGHSLTTVCLRGPAGGDGGFHQMDPLPVNYTRIRIPTLRLGKFLVVWPSLRLWQLLMSSRPLLLHLPCPTVLIIGMLTRAVKPRRKICVYWHAFLSSSRWPVNVLLAAYEFLALRWIKLAGINVLTTSPVLAVCLRQKGIDDTLIAVLPCCLSEIQERLCLQKHMERLTTKRQSPDKIKLVFVGRLGTYKRVDLLVKAFAGSAASELHIIGDGDTVEIQELILQFVPVHQRVILHGRLDEKQKIDVIAACDVLFLPSYTSNEAFGIVQLEAMACGLAVCAPTIVDSGLGWVGSLDLINGNIEPTVAIREAIHTLSCSENLNSSQARCLERYQQLFARDVWLSKFNQCRDRFGA